MVRLQRPGDSWAGPEGDGALALAAGQRRHVTVVTGRVPSCRHENIAIVIEPDDSVLLLVEPEHYDEIKRRRNRDRESLMELEEAPTEDREGDLWFAMTYSREPHTFDLESARYRQVCIVASEESPARQWISFFRWSMPTLVAAGGLHVCTPPYDRARATVVPLSEDPA